MHTVVVRTSYGRSIRVCVWATFIIGNRGQQYGDVITAYVITKHVVMDCPYTIEVSISHFFR